MAKGVMSYRGQRPGAATISRGQRFTGSKGNGAGLAGKEGMPAAKEIDTRRGGK